MKLVLSPHKPVKYLAPFAVLCVIVPLGRFLAGDGTVWTLLGGAGMFALFAIAGRNWEAVDQLGASFTKWMNSAAFTMITGSGVLALVTAASSVINQKLNPYYKGYDFFLFTTDKPVEWATSPGPFADSSFVPEPYLVENAGQSILTVALTALLTFTFFALCCVGGLALGLTMKRRGGLLFPAAVVIAIVAYAITYTVLAFPYTSGQVDPVDPAHMIVPLAEPRSVPIAAASIAGLIMLSASTYMIARTPRLRR